MASISRYTKPNMANLPSELGKKIFDQILNSSAPDRNKMKAESDRLVKDMIKEREKELAEQEAAK